MLKLAIVTVFLFTIQGNDCARIFCVFSYPTAAHQKVFRTLTEELLQRGHELTVVTSGPSYPDNENPRFKEINVHDVSYNMWTAETLDHIQKLKENLDKVRSPRIAENLHKLFMLQFGTEEFQKIIKGDNKFDLILLEERLSSSIIVSHFIKAPVILVSASGSLFDNNVMGYPRQEFLYPSLLRQKKYNVSFWEQIYDIYDVMSFQRAVNDLKEVQNAAFTDIVGQYVTMDELYYNVDMMMLNQYPVWAGIHPVPQNLVYLGGIYTKPAEELPQDLKQFFNTSTDDVIYVSLGSALHVSLYAPDKLWVISRVLSQLPYDVLWEWDSRDLSGKGPNIKTFKGLPQADVLRQPKVKLFITLGGHQSTDEAIAAGVPLIGIPFMGDQFFNAENYVRHNIGLKLDLDTLTEDDLKAAVTKVITDKGYRDNVVHLRTIMRDQRLYSLNHAIWWIHHVLTHRGGKHLLSPAAHMSWIQYMELELLFIVLLSLLLFFLVSVGVSYFLYKVSIKCYKRYTYRRLMIGMHYAR